MIRQYVEEALRGARYEKLEDGSFYGEVPRLRGVLASAETLEDCRNQLAEVVEEWVLVRVQRVSRFRPSGKSASELKKRADATVGTDGPQGANQGPSISGL